LRGLLRWLKGKKKIPGGGENASCSGHVTAFSTETEGEKKIVPGGEKGRWPKRIKGGRFSEEGYGTFSQNCRTERLEEKSLKGCICICKIEKGFLECLRIYQHNTRNRKKKGAPL